MKKTTLFVLLLTVALQFTNAQEVITNASIIQMKELGFDETIILSKINSSDVDFDASISALSKLKKSGVSSEVIALVMQKAEFSTKSKTGIYYLAADDSLKPILASVFSGTNQNAVAQQLVSGLINAKVKSQLPKRTSNNVITSRSPEFTFIFDPDTSADNMQNFQGKSPNLFNWWFRVATSPNEFVLVTAHRSENVDNPETLKNILLGLEQVNKKFKKRIIYPMHPRTKSKLKNKDIPKCIEIIKPLGFFDFSKLEQHAFCYVTDSGTLPEDALIYKKPCVIVRESFERPEFIEAGCNILSGLDPKNIVESVKTITSAVIDWEWNESLGDGRTSSKVINIIRGKLIRTPSKF